MSVFSRPVSGRRAIIAAGIAVAITACGSHAARRPSMPGIAISPTGGHHSPMPSMSAMPSGNGLATQQNGYTLISATTTLPAGKPATYRFTITGPDHRPVTDFAINLTKRLHFYAIRSDLTGFQHLHPTMTEGGTWTAHLAALKPGSWRLYTQFTPNTGPGKGQNLILSRTLTVPGKPSTVALPAPASTTTVDDYTLTVGGHLKAHTETPLTVTIHKHGKPVTDLQPYLDTYAHLTAFHQNDQAFAHLHPHTKATGPHGGPTLHFMADLPEAGNWRLFLQFKTAGTLYTAAITVHAS